MSKSTTTLWHDSMTDLATQLSNGVLTEMKRRILTSNIQKEKLQLDEDTDRMRHFFEREIARYNKRKQYVNAQKHDHSELINQLVKCNISLARKCVKNNIAITKVPIQTDEDDDAIFTWS